MAILAGIGRALTSVGSDLQRNRLEREEREQRFADLKEQRAYAETIREQEAGIRADETQANRDWSIRQQAAQNLYAAGRTARQNEYQEGQTALQNIEFDRRADLAAGRASDVVNARLDQEQDIYDQGLEGLRDIMLAGELTEAGQTRADAPEMIRRLPERGDVRTPTPRSYADVGRARIPLPTTTPPTRYQPTEPMMERAEEDIYREQGAYDPVTGNLVGDTAPFSDVFDRAYQVANRNPNLDPRQPTVREPSMFTPPVFGAEVVGAARDAVAGRGQQQRGQPEVAPPGIDPEEYRRMLDSGATPEMIQRWIAREAARGGR